MSSRPSYLRVFLTFARNSLVRDMTFRANFLIDTFSSMKHQLKSTSPDGALAHRVAQTLATRYDLTRFTPPLPEAHEDD